MKLLNDYPWLKRWETLLFVLFCLSVLINTQMSEHYFNLDNFANIFRLSIEKSFVVLIMAFVIINGEIDLSVASVMGLAAAVLANEFDHGRSLEESILIAMLVGAGCGLLNGALIAYLRIPSLVVTLAGLIAYRGAARYVLEDRSIGGFPSWFTGFGLNEFIGPFQATTILFFVLFAVFLFILQFTTFGRYVYVIGNNREAAEYAGLRVRQIKILLYVISGTMSAFAGLLYATQYTDVQASVAQGFELDIITIVLLGGVSIFGGKGNLVGVGLSLLTVLNVRNGMSLRHLDGNIQAGVVGLLLIFSVLIPNWATSLQHYLTRLSRNYKKTSSLANKEVAETS